MSNFVIAYEFNNRLEKFCLIRQDLQTKHMQYALQM